MTSKDVLEAVPDTEWAGAWVIKSHKYKTSILYGTKLLILPRDIYDMLVMYIKKLRPIITAKYQSDDEKLGKRPFLPQRIFSKSI